MFGGTLERHSKPGCQSVGPSDSLFETTCESSGCDGYSWNSLSCKWPAFPQRQWLKKKKKGRRKERIHEDKEEARSFIFNAPATVQITSRRNTTDKITSKSLTRTSSQLSLHSTRDAIFLNFIFMGNSACFPRGKPAATESSYPTYGACWVF